MSTFKFASVSLRKKNVTLMNQSLDHILYPENTEKPMLFLLGSSPWGFPHALVSHTVHCSLFFHKKPPVLPQSSSRASVASCKPLGKWMLWSAHSCLQHVPSLQLLVIYRSVTLTDTVSEILEFLSQKGFAVGRTRYFYTPTTQQKKHLTPGYEKNRKNLEEHKICKSQAISLSLCCINHTI